MPDEPENQFVDPKVDFEGAETPAGEAVEQKTGETITEIEKTGEDHEKLETTREEKADDKEVNFQDFLKDRGVEFDQTKIEADPGKTKTKTAPRVLDDIPEEDRPIFKNMSIESFNKLKPLYLEHKQLKAENEQLKQNKGKESASIFGHPEAFTLTKEYKTSSGDYNLAERIKSHWATQAAKVSRGEKWQDLDMDPKTGKLILSEPKESNAEAEVFIGDQLQFAREQSYEAGKKLKNYIDSYDSTYKADLAIVTGAVEKYFPGYTAKDHPTQAIQKAVLDALPASFRDNPVSTLLAMTAANNAILMGRLKKATDELNKLKGIKTDADAAQPRKGEFVAGKAGNGGVKFSDFQNRRSQDV